MTSKLSLSNLCTLSAAVLQVVLCGAMSLAAERQFSGHQLFVHRWTADEGLGPVFNAESCVACHFQGGIGGGGPNENNVQLLSVVPKPNPTSLERTQLTEKLADVHPSFSLSNPSIVFHKFHSNSNYQTWRFDVLGFVAPKRLNESRREVVLKNKQQALLRKGGAVTVKSQGVPMIFSQRNTPALFGAGMLDQVSDELIQQIAENQSNSNSPISGRLGGKFGWRGQTETLKDFVFGACANELGLQTPGHLAPTDPMTTSFSQSLNELSEFECDKLTKMVASLPAPRRQPPATAEAQALVTNGERLFHTVGCTDCHVQNLGNVTDVFSDLLLHDMGHGLADPVGAVPVRHLIDPQGAGPSGSGYFGGGTSSRKSFADVVDNGSQEWKTPPLWGVASSGPWLHDGRARTLHQAIMLHAGEAEVSRKRYAALDGPSKQRIVGFLRTLVAPDARTLPQK